jgi:hypothetical protein
VLGEGGEADQAEGEGEGEGEEELGPSAGHGVVLWYRNGRCLAKEF